ncbi:formate dehydrogenase accessory protein FdhE [Nonomuraea sp. MTCD27]|uniref:formate dehydrogenase accessory protein FdhE domain-containing protein n=1 Tax=Nonomuraea sp. MTCD27 TaxID=1676747 RepID=UPI0035C12B8A
MYGRERVRAGELRDRYPHAAGVLGLYLALVEVWESVGDDVPADGALEWAEANVLPRVLAATAAAGPRPLADAITAAGAAATGTGLLDAWAADEDLTPVERYLARATMHVVPPKAWTARAGARSGGRCAACGGAAQLSYRTASDDPLVSGRRMLACAKCPHEWNFSATTCPNCGETGKRTVHAETHAATEAPHVGRAAPDDRSVFPHLRAESCQTCRSYLIDVDLGRDPRAVPRVDELAAVPIDLHLTGQGYTKITPNLMGF